MAWFIVIYFIAGFLLCIFGILYAYSYLEKRGMIDTDIEKLIDDVAIYVNMPVTTLSDNLYYRVILEIISIVLLPITSQFVVYYTLKEGDRLCNEKHGS